MLVSFIVLSDDTAHLEEQLESIAAQGLAPDQLEVLLAAPGALSPAESAVSPAGVAVHVVAPEPDSVGQRLNRAARRASGTWLLFLRDDAVLPAGRLPAALARAAADPRSPRIGRSRFIPSAGPDSVSDYLNRAADAVPATPGVKLSPTAVHWSGLLIDRALFLESGGFDEQLRGQVAVDLAVRVKQSGSGVVFDPDVALARRTAADIDRLCAEAVAEGRAKVLLADRYPGLYSLDALRDSASATFVPFGDGEIARWRETALRIAAMPVDQQPAKRRRVPRGDLFEFNVLDWLLGLIFAAATGKGLDQGLRAREGSDWREQFLLTSGLWDPLRMHVAPRPKAPEAAAGLHGPKRISVVIPVRNGAASIERCLRSFAHQTLRPDQYELVIANDGSTDDTAAICRGFDARCEIRVIDLPPSGQGPATNRAIEQCRGDYVLLAAGDIVAEHDLLERHLAQHANATEEIGVLGYLPYHPELTITPFMKFIVADGTQFGYAYIRDPENVPPSFAYAPNLSYWRQTLLEVGGFDEDYVWGMQDIDLGVRMRRAGVRMVYDAQAIGWHYHPTTLEHYLWNRQPFGGHACVVFTGKWPYLLSLGDLKRTCVNSYTTLSKRPQLIERMIAAVGRVEALPEAERPVLFVVDPMQRASAPAVYWLYETLLRHAYAKGIHDELVTREGEDWVQRYLAGEGVAVEYDPELLLRDAEDRLRAIERYVDGPGRAPVPVPMRGAAVAELRYAPAFYEELQADVPEAVGTRSNLQGALSGI